MTDSNAPSCPLCHGHNSDLLEQVPGPSLNAAWQKSFGIRAGICSESVDYRRCRVCTLQFFMPPEDGDAILYETLQRQAWYYMDDKPEYVLAHRYLPTDGAVLEVGAGKAAFAKRVGRARYLGLEFNDAAIERARHDGITLIRQPVQEHAQVHPGRYAAVVSFQVLEHVADPAGFIAGCVQALVPGGILILAVPDHDGLCGLAQNNVLDMPPHHASHWNEAALRHIGSLYPLEVLAVEREPVTAQHAPWAERAVTERRLRGLFGMQSRVLDTSFAGRLVGRISAHLARALPPSISHVTGHTILAAYRRRAL